MDSSQKHSRLETSATVATASLLPELIVDILSRLPVKSLGRCRCVSRLWLGLIKHPRFIEMHRSRNPPQRLLFDVDLCCSSGCRMTRQLMYTLSFYCLHFKITPTGGVDCNLVTMETEYPCKRMSRCWFEILGSCNGLLCITPAPKFCHKQFYVCNPSIKECKRILYFNPPRLKRNNDIEYGFGYAKSGSDDDYKIVMVDTSRNIIDLYSLRNDSWKSISNDKGPGVQGSLSMDCVYTIDNKGPGVSLNGAIHWLYRTGKLEPQDVDIAAFDLVEEKFKILPLPDSAARHRSFMVTVMGGCLCIMPQDGMASEFWVMKYYGVKESWTKISLSCSLRIFRPLFFLKESEDMLLFSVDKYLVHSNKKDGKVKQVRLDDDIASMIAYSFKAVQVYEESLVSPNYNSCLKSEEKVLQYWFK